MNRPQRAHIARGAASLLGLLVMLVLPPVLLIVLVGWPLPTTIPSWAEVQTSLTIGLRNEVVVKGIALVTWLLWLYVAASTVIATVAELRGRRARRLPLFPGVQQSIGRLVASAYLAFTTLGAGTVGSAGLATIPVVQLTGLPEPEREVSPLVANPPGQHRKARSTATALVDRPALARTLSGDPLVTIEARRHDSYWAIAERVLGDGVRWHEIRDLNVGRKMPNGHVISTTDDVVRPGWTLLVPGSPQQVPDSEPGPQPPTGASTVTVQPGDNMWDLAENHLNASLGRENSADEVTPYWVRFVDENHERLADPGNPDLIYPGQEFIFPEVDEADQLAPAVAPVEVVALPVTPETTCPPATEAPEVEKPSDHEVVPAPTTTSDDQSPEREQEPSREAGDEPDREEDDEGPGIGVVTVLGAVGTALAVGVVRELRRRQRLRNYRSPRTLPVPSRPTQAQREITALADDDAHHTLRVALDELAGVIATKGLQCRPRVVQRSPDSLEVLWDRAAGPAPDGWEANASGAVWARTPEGLAADRLHIALTEDPAATPLLAHLGQPDDGQEVYLDLETARVVTVGGDKAVAAGLLRAMATELAFSPLAEGTDILVVGDLAADLDNLDRITAVGTWDEAAREIANWAEQSREALAAQGWLNTFVARGFRSHDDSLRPLVVVASGPPTDNEVLDDLLAGPPSSVAVVVYGAAADGATLIECSPDELRAPQLNLAVRPAPLDPDVVAEVVELLDMSDESSGEPYELFPDDPEADEPLLAPDEMPTPYEDPPHDVLVRLLGYLTVDGIGEPLTGRQLSVVAYLAVHRTVSVDQLETAVWATEADGSHRKRLGNLIAECRNRVGRDNLPGAVDGHYTVGPRILTDVDLFERRVRAAAHQPQPIAAETLTGALELVRGPIFTYRTADQASFAWVDLENWVAIWEQKITGVAQHLAEIRLDAGDIERAIDVAERTLRVVPTHSAITETLMRAHAANGDRHAIRRVYAVHVRSLDHLDLDEPATSTTDLYHELLRTTPP